MFENFISQLPSYVISLPVILLALSFHEMCHGYVALKLGDPTARNLGRLTLNPIKHLHPLGFLMMLFFHVGFANPVPINSRNFKKPRRDMALSALAGPLSNVLLAIVSAIILRLLLLLCQQTMVDDLYLIYTGILTGSAYRISAIGTILSILVYMSYLSVIINISYAVFNMLPIPPWDGSRVFYVFLPNKWYFGIMKYERIIMIGMFILLMTGFLDAPLQFITNGISSGLFYLTGMDYSSEPFYFLHLILNHINSLL
ncbi:MAG: site-2 protease family protein [Clostridia bacterium]|nr:site-2 protease family protein [Clostridia bacterium]